MINIVVSPETPENALIRVIRDEIGNGIPITINGSIKSGNLTISIDIESLPPVAIQRIEVGIDRALKIRGIKNIMEIETVIQNGN